MNRTEYANKEVAVKLLNKFYLNEYTWPNDAEINANMAAFKYTTERVAGVKLDLKLETDNMGRYGFAIQSVEIVEPSRWTMFVLRWS